MDFPQRLRRHATPAAIAAVIALGIGLTLYAFWPGVMIDDARWQYQQAVDNAFEDWHPPLMAWVWRRLMFVLPGPAPMLLLQVALYWAGIGLIAAWAHRRGHSRLALALIFIAWLPAPFALTGTVTKDALMSGLLGCATGLLLWRDFAKTMAGRGALSAVAVTSLVLTSALRFNAFLACVPLALAAAPRRFTRTKPRMFATSGIAAMLFLCSGPLVSQLVAAEPTGVSHSLMIFDLGGITEYSGVNAFPDMRVSNPVAVNHRCYDPTEWDSYSSWAKVPCPLGFEPFEALVDEGDISPTRIWLRAVASHPIAYAEHRLGHFNLSTWFLVSGGPHFTAWSQSVPNPWGYQVQHCAVSDAVVSVTNVAAATPLGWPIFWICMALAFFILAVSAKLRPEVIALAASSFLYGMGYLIFGVAVGMRYYSWTMTASALAAVLVTGTLGKVHRSVAAAASVIVALPTLMAIAARLLI